MTDEATLRTILVPLDGSVAAEQALPLATAIARRTGASLHLVQIEPRALSPRHRVPAWDAALRQRALVYLRETAERVRADGVDASVAVRGGAIAAGLLREAERHGAGLVVMTTHGHGPVGRAWFGSIADEMIRTAGMPVLLVRSRAQGEATTREVSRVVVPLDGSPLAEQALEHAAALARAFDAPVALARVVGGQEAGRGVPAEARSSAGAGATAPESEPPRAAEEAEAEAYLERTARRFAAEHDVRVEHALLRGEFPADAILSFPREPETEIIALTTHGLSGVRRLLLGSVADKVVRAAAGPVLVFRPAKEP